MQDVRAKHPHTACRAQDAAALGDVLVSRICCTCASVDSALAETLRAEQHIMAFRIFCETPVAIDFV